MAILKKPQVLAVIPKKQHHAMRPLEDRIAEIESKLAYHARSIESLEKKKAALEKPRRHRLSYAKVFAELKASGKSPQEILSLFTGYIR